KLKPRGWPRNSAGAVERGGGGGERTGASVTGFLDRPWEGDVRQFNAAFSELDPGEQCARVETAVLPLDFPENREKNRSFSKFGPVRPFLRCAGAKSRGS